MTKLIDETGHRYGLLTVIKKVVNEKDRMAWLCDCDCGKSKIVKGSYLRAGLVKSCGCLFKFPKGEAGFRNAWGHLKKNARNRKLEFSLTQEFVKRLHSKPCWYCGSLPSNGKGCLSNCNGEYIYNGIDRIDNAKGYTVDNVVPCCFICNRAKRDMSISKFQDWIKKLISFNKGKR
jgi:hypothetical protein